MDLFYLDYSTNQKITWSMLLNDINRSTTFNPYCYQGDFYTVLKQIILSLILGKEIILLDGDFTLDEIEKLTGISDFRDSETIIKFVNLLNLTTKKELLERLNKVNSNWSITLFTSGTTGLPKKVSHKFESITRFVKTAEKNRSNIWGFAYNPTHMAGVQVFFQALLNGNTIVRLFGLSKEHIFDSISTYRVTNISATPTFYRLLLPANNEYSTVSRITSGGEKFDDKTFNQLKDIFPKAKITNIYATSEAGTLLAANGNEFTIKHSFIDQIKIENNELIIHKSLLGNSSIVNEEWYRTGDLVQIISFNPTVFRFVSRKNEMINVGGYKVNPLEVEEEIRAVVGVQDVRVYAKSNSVLGNIICCEVVKRDSQLNETIIRTNLQSKLQEFKIPRMVKFVEKISTTRTGKIKRN